MDGFFVAKLKKYANGERKADEINENDEIEMKAKEDLKKKMLNKKKKQQKKQKKEEKKKAEN